MIEPRMVCLLDLSPAFSTRRRGAETFLKLLPLLQDGPVVLDLDGIDLMPVSFLDGLMLRLMEKWTCRRRVFQNNKLPRNRQAATTERVEGCRHFPEMSIR